MRKYFVIPATLLLWLTTALGLAGWHWSLLGRACTPPTILGSSSSTALAQVFSLSHVLIGSGVATAVFALAAGLLSLRRDRRRRGYVIECAVEGAGLSLAVFSLARLMGLGASGVLVAFVIGVALFGRDNGTDGLIGGRYGDSWRNY